MNVDLILLSFDENIPYPDWSLGQVRIVEPTIQALNELSDRFLPQSGAWLFWSADLGQPDSNLISQTLSSSADLWHAGLALGMGGLPRSIDYVAPTWMLNCDPPVDIEATSWRVSLKACLVRVDVLRQMGFLHSEFRTLDAATLEWGHRCIRLGVIMRHLPALIGKQTLPISPSLNFEDELRFVRLRFGKKWQVWSSIRALISFQVRPGSVLKANLRLMGELYLPDPEPFHREVKSTNLMMKDSRVSVLIPTVDRYAYLEVLLSQLIKQTHPPYEIIIIDQTPLSKRKLELYNEFVDLPLKLVFLDHVGQCASRNAGLKIASGDYILFIDDDDEIQTDLIERHLFYLQNHFADASCGVANELGVSLPEAFTFQRVADVFPTNNSLLCRNSLEKSGLFDLAFDHGARADADLGTRLYLSGASLILNSDISVLHHHAPRGGLRTHKARVITYASSRQKLIERNIPSATEIYMIGRYFTPRQLYESFWISIFASFSLHHPSRWWRLLKAIVSFFLLTDTLLQLRQNKKQAQQLKLSHPTIPQLAEHKGIF